MLIIICGLPGSGKTTLAAALAGPRGAVLLSSDVIRKRMFPAPAYSDEEKARVYEEMASQCAKALSGGSDVVADATFYKRAIRERFRAIAAEAGTQAFVLLCSLEERHAKERLDRRGRSGHSDADFEVRMKMKSGFEPVSGTHLEIDARLPLEKRVEAAERFVGWKHG